MALVDATVGSPGSVIRRIAVPAILQTLLHTAYGFTDYVFVARLDDTSAIAALSASFGVGVIAYGLTEIASVGVQTLAAQLTGARAWGRRRRLIGTTCALAVALSVPITLIGVLAPRAVAGVLHLGPEATEHATAYLRILLCGYPVLSLTHTVSGAWRGMGYTVAPIAIEGSVLALNTVGNGVLVLGWFGGPHMGVAGAALATILAALPPTAAGLWALIRQTRRSEAELGPGEGAAGLTRTTVRHDIREILAVGLPASVIPLVYGIAYTGLNRIAGVAGEAAQAGLGASIRGVEWVAWSACLGFYVAATVGVGQCVGAGQPERARALAWRTMLYAMIWVEAVGLLMALGAPIWMRWVVPDPTAQALGVTYLRWIGPALFLLALEITLEGALVGLGRTRIPMWISLVMTAGRLPLAAVLVFGSEHLLDGTAFAIGLQGGIDAQVPSVSDGFFGIVLTILLSTVGKAIWAAVAMLRVDFSEDARRRRERFGLGMLPEDPMP